MDTGLRRYDGFRVATCQSPWLIVSESNRFTWPGPDVKPVDARRESYGPMPPRLYVKARDRFLERARERCIETVERTVAGWDEEI